MKFIVGAYYYYVGKRNFRFKCLGANSSVITFGKRNNILTNVTNSKQIWSYTPKHAAYTWVLCDKPKVKRKTTYWK